MNNKLPIISFQVVLLFLLFVQPCDSMEIKNDQFWPNCPDLTQFFSTMSSGQTKWGDLYEYFKKYKNKGCDDGVYAEVYGEFIEQRLAQHWNHIADLVQIITSDNSFEEFIIRHIDSTGNASDIKKILRNAKQNCPKGQERFCSAIADQAQKAIAEME